LARPRRRCQSGHGNARAPLLRLAFRNHAGGQEAHRHPARGRRSHMKSGRERELGDPFLKANTSAGNRMLRACWGLAYTLLFRPSPRPLHAWRAFLLRRFGATLGSHTRIYPRARIWAPWNLVCEDTVAIADDAQIYNPALVTLRSHSIVSQQAFLCGATH